METSTSEKILDTAEFLIVAGGYNGFSYADISDAIGIRKASIHHHFPTKAILVATLVERYVQRAYEGLHSLRDHIDAPDRQLEAYANYWQACILDASNPFCMCAMLASEIQVLPEEVAVKVRRHFSNLVEWLTVILDDGAERGLFQLEGTTEQEANILVAAVHGALLSARATGQPEIFSKIILPQFARLSR